jgi:hypothetical protein
MSTQGRFDKVLTAVTVVCICIILLGMLALEALQTTPDLWPQIVF